MSKVHPNENMLGAIADVMERITDADEVEAMLAAVGQAAAKMMAVVVAEDDELRAMLEWFHEQVESDALKFYHLIREHPEEFR